jgi:hypothetical protein
MRKTGGIMTNQIEEFEYSFLKKGMIQAVRSDIDAPPTPFATVSARASRHV